MSGMAEIHEVMSEITDYLRPGLPIDSGSIARGINRHPEIVEKALKLLYAKNRIKDVDEVTLDEIRALGIDVPEGNYIALNYVRNK